jgi:hypothetical protein
MTFGLGLHKNHVELKTGLVKIPTQRRSVAIGKGRIRQFLKTKGKKEVVLE